jgi:hypothetical protein
MSSSQQPGRSNRRRQSSSLLIPIIGGIIGFVAALFLLRELDIFEGTSPPPPPAINANCTYPLGSYFDQLCNLVARATVEIQTVIEPETATRCVDENLDCRVHRENLRRGLPTSERFRDALFDLEPPEQAEDWHNRYLTAVSLLHSGYNAQFVALQDNDREAFLVAHERTVAAASETGALFDDFEIAFTDERDP